MPPRPYHAIRQARQACGRGGGPFLFFLPRKSTTIPTIPMIRASNPMSASGSIGTPPATVYPCISRLLKQILAYTRVFLVAFSITPTTCRGPTSRTHVTFNSIIPQRNCVHKNYFSLSPVPDDATSPNRGFMRTYIRLDDASTHAHVGPVELPGPVHLCRRARLPPARRFLRKPFRHGKSSCYSRTRPLLKHPFMRNLITKSERLEEPRP